MSEDFELHEVKERLALIEARLQQLFEHLDIAPREGSAGGDPEIEDLLAKGNEAQAIKRYTELTGASLREAKQAIEQLKG